MTDPKPNKGGRPRLPRDENGKIVYPPGYVRKYRLRPAPKGDRRPIDPEKPASVPADAPDADSILHTLPPRRLPGGAPNPAHYREWLNALNERAFRSVMHADGKLPYGFKQLQEGILNQAKLDGLDAAEVMDNREESEKDRDFMLACLEAPEEFFAVTEAVCDKLERMMDRADEFCQDAIDDRVEAQAAKKKRWVALLKRVRRLRQRAKLEKPPGPSEIGVTQQAIRAAWLLRFMLYVGRSNAIESGAPEESRVYTIGPHHARCSLAIDMAEHKWDIDGHGISEDGFYTYEGVALIIPMRHGKTELGTAFTTRRIVQDRSTQALLLHAKSDEASKNLVYVQQWLDPATENGRRLKALFPDIALAGRKGNNARTIKIKTKRALRQPTAKAHGVTERILGSNANFAWPDDPVPMSDRDEETERKRRYDTISGTILSRLQRQKNSFYLITATLWHYDDAVARRVRLALEGKIWMKVHIERCGGPDSHPPFEAIWPEMYDAKYLRAKYQELRNPSLYSAIYRSDPQAEESRIVRKLAIYDPESDEHAAFMAGSTKYVSIDPSASNREKAHKAGFLAAALGDVRTESLEPGIRKVTNTVRLRITHAEEFNATGSEMFDHATAFAASNPVDYVMVEGVTGFRMLTEQFQRLGIDAIDMQPGTKSKKLRLQACAGFLDASLADKGGMPAVVEFPGVLEDGRWRIDPRFAFLADEILLFGATAADATLDALTQMVNYLSPQLASGVGVVTQQIQDMGGWDAIRERRKAQVRRMLARQTEGPAPLEDWRFMCRN